MCDNMSQFQGGICVWNVRGIQHSNFKRLLVEFVARKKIKIPMLIETRLDGQKGIQFFVNLLFSNVEMTNTIGFVGSIYLLWN